MAATESLLRERVEQSAFTISVIDDFDRFGSLRTEWRDLLRSSSSNNPFLTWEWLHAWWKHLNGGRTLQILTGTIRGLPAGRRRSLVCVARTIAGIVAAGVSRYRVGRLRLSRPHRPSRL